MLKAMPTLLAHSEDTVMQKMKFYKNEFDLSSEEFSKMLKFLPSMLGFSEESIKQKHQQMRDIDISKDILVKNPTNLKKIKKLIKFA